MVFSRLHQNPSRTHSRVRLLALTIARTHVHTFRLPMDCSRSCRSRSAPPRAALGTAVCAAVRLAFGPIAAVGRIDATAIAAAEPQSAGAGVKPTPTPSSAAKAKGMGSGGVRAAYPWLSKLSRPLEQPLVAIELCDAPLRFEVSRSVYRRLLYDVRHNTSRCCRYSIERLSCYRNDWL